MRWTPHPTRTNSPKLKKKKLFLTSSSNSPRGEKDLKVDDDPIDERAKLNSHNNSSPDADNVKMLGNSSKQASEVSPKHFV